MDIGESNADVYKEAIEQKLEKSIKMAEWKNGAPDYFKKDVIKETSEMQNIKKYSESYVRYDEKSDSFTVNRWAYLNELFAYDVQHENYQDSIIVKKQLEESGFGIKGEEKRSDYKEQLKCILVKEGFADRMKRYCELRQLKETNPYYLADEIMERQYEDLRLYYDRLGYERIKALGFKEKDLKNELERCYRENDIKRKFREVFIVGERMSTEDIKRTMTEIYANYGIRKNGVAKQLERDYGIRLKSVKVKMPGGIRKGGYEFI